MVLLSEDDIEEIRQKKLEELKEKKGSQEELEQRKQQQEAQKKKLLKKIMTSEARQRLSNLRMAKPEFVESIEQQLILLAQKGSIQGKIDDDQFKKILKKAQSDSKDINIKRR
ncbi:DNA-binding protein [archaeon SCG-AAA382B04]|nr:DNA-binding protein [archaeon SCG-AAA382B04]